MNMRGRRFELDRSEGKLLGVCAGIANATGVDPTIVRVALVMIALFGSHTWTLAAYLGAALFGHLRSRGGQGLSRIASGADTHERMRNLDLRMQAIEHVATSSNSRLAREIEDLRRN